jgi:hypothetical protein
MGVACEGWLVGREGKPWPCQSPSELGPHGGYGLQTLLAYCKVVASYGLEFHDAHNRVGQCLGICHLP